MSAWRRFLHGARRLFACAAAAAASAALGSGGCSSAEQCGSGECPDGQRCTQDRCSAACSDQSDCPIGENCALWEFPDGERGSFCVILDYARDGSTGQFEACSSDAECDTPRGWSCLGGECRRPCRTHLDCTGIGHCAAGEAETRYCVAADTPPVPGGFGTRCPNGDECGQGFSCRSAGPGDFNAYCTKDCSGDGDCGAGMRCVSVRSARLPCEETCGLAPGTAEDCVPLSEIGEGRPYRCGPISLVRDACVYREFCDSCETDEDCLGVPDQICALDAGGNKICTTRCDPALSGCPWGSATTCSVSDPSLGFATCSHRFGSCQGSGAGCEPCRWDEDCGEDGLCVQSSFTGERFCLDLGFTCSCQGEVIDPQTGSCLGGGCPTTPGGLQMTCLDTDTYSGTSVHRTCFGAVVASGPVSDDRRTGCWPLR